MATEFPEGINRQATPSGPGCKLCTDGDGPGWWMHLRRCAECGQIGCCDSSPSKHATAHVHASGHHITRSYEPGEDWFYNFETEKFFYGPPLPPPTSRPVDQASPGPLEKLPPEVRAQHHE